MSTVNRCRLLLIVVFILGYVACKILSYQVPLSASPKKDVIIQQTDPNAIYGEVESIVRHLQETLVLKGYQIKVDGLIGIEETLPSANAEVYKERAQAEREQFNQYAAKSMYAPEMTFEQLQKKIEENNGIKEGNNDTR